MCISGQWSNNTVFVHQTCFKQSLMLSYMLGYITKVTSSEVQAEIPASEQRVMTSVI